RRPAETAATQPIGWGDPVLASGSFHRRERAALVPRSECCRASGKRHSRRGCGLFWESSAIQAHAGPAMGKSGPGGTLFGGLLAACRNRRRARSAVARPLLGGSEIRSGTPVWQASGGLARHGHRPFRLAGAYAACQRLAETKGAEYFAKNACP